MTTPEGAAGARDEAAVRRFVEHLAITLEEMGFPRMPARVLVTLTAADEPTLTAADLSQRLDVSPAAISGAIRYLSHIGLIVREPVPGSRTLHYRLPDDVFYESSVTRRGPIKMVADLATEGVGAVGGPDTAAGQRLAEMAGFYRFIDTELDGMLARWQETKARNTGT
jgi:MarR family